MSALYLSGVVTRKLEILSDLDAHRVWLPELVKLIGMKPVGEPHLEAYPHWPGSAPSSVQFIEESAIVIHTYPEANFIELLLHSCKEIPDQPAVIASIEDDLGLIRYRLNPPMHEWDWRHQLAHPPPGLESVLL